MKNYNLGSDYAYQQRLKKTENVQASQPIVESQISPIENVNHQIQTGGESDVAAISDEPVTEGQTLPKKPKKASKEKKKEKSDILQ